jgi:hypothetical protein
MRHAPTPEVSSTTGVERGTATPRRSPGGLSIRFGDPLKVYGDLAADARRGGWSGFGAADPLSTIFVSRERQTFALFVTAQIERFRP